MRLINNSNNIVTTLTKNQGLIIDKDDNSITIEKLILKDENGNKWKIKIIDGELVIEPLDKQSKINFKIDKILKK